MARKKKIREKGKIKFSEYFKKLQKGDKVAVVKELASKASFPNYLQGRTGTISGKRGRYCIVDINIGKNKLTKTFIIHPVHLKKLKSSK
jgi:ribosomal protein L21E